MNEIHRCGNTWMYCDGNCTNCTFFATSTSTNLSEDGEERRMRLIDADAIEYYDGEYPPTPCVSKKYIDSLPTIEPKTGEWYDWNFTAFDGCTVWHRVCSVCGYKRDDDNLDKDTNYCPNCGAKMERSEE